MPHIHEKIDFTVETFSIVHKDKVLLRKHDKYKIWLSVGGHVELNEDPNQAAVREAKEEVGLDITLAGEIPQTEHFEDYQELLAPRFLDRNRINETHEHITMVYFAKSWTDKITQGDTEISNDIRWFTAKELNSTQNGDCEKTSSITQSEHSKRLGYAICYT